MNSMKKTITCLAILTGICGNAVGATGFGLSNIFTIDNRNADGSGLSNIFTIDNRGTEEGPFVTAVSSQYCSQSQGAYFLAGVPLEQRFTAEIDWGDKAPAQVKWYRDSSVIATDTVSGDSVGHTFNVGTEFNVGDRLYVQARPCRSEPPLPPSAALPWWCQC